MKNFHAKSTIRNLFTSLLLHFLNKECSEKNLKKYFWKTSLLGDIHAFVFHSFLLGFQAYVSFFYPLDPVLQQSKAWKTYSSKKPLLDYEQFNPKTIWMFFVSKDHQKLYTSEIYKLSSFSFWYKKTSYKSIFQPHQNLHVGFNWPYVT